MGQLIIGSDIDHCLDYQNQFFLFFLYQMVENRNQQNQVCVHHNNPHVGLKTL